MIEIFNIPIESLLEFKSAIDISLYEKDENIYLDIIEKHTPKKKTIKVSNIEKIHYTIDSTEEIFNTKKKYDEYFIFH